MWDKDEPPPKELALQPVEPDVFVPAADYPPPKKKWQRDREIAKANEYIDELYQKSLSVLDAGTNGATNYDDDEDRQQVSADEIKTHGTVEAALRYKRVAMDARRTKKAAPVYFENAKTLVSAISKMKAAQEKRGSDGGGGPTINVYINNQTVNNTYEEVELKEDDEE